MMTFSTKLMDLQFFNRVRTHSRSIEASCFREVL